MWTIYVIAVDHATAKEIAEANRYAKWITAPIARWFAARENTGEHGHPYKVEGITTEDGTRIAQRVLRVCRPHRVSCHG